MKITYKISDKMQCEIEEDGQKEIFKKLSSIQEIFGEAECGLCKCTNLRFAVRSVEGNDYYELKCTKWGARLALG